MPKRTRDHNAWLLKQLEDPKVAAAYLNAAADDSIEMFLIALRKVAESHRMTKVAEEAGVSREALYKTLSEEGNPRLDTLTAVLKAVGLRLILEPEEVTPSGGIPLDSIGDRQAAPPPARSVNITRTPRGTQHPFPQYPIKPNPLSYAPF